MKSFVVQCLLLFIAYVSSSSGDNVPHLTHITLIGSYGDLAKRYLWKGFFNLYQQYQHDENSFQFYGGGRNEISLGSPMLDEILTEKLSCSSSNDYDVCVTAKQTFIDGVSYVQLKTSQQYQSHCDRLKKDYLQHCPSGGCQYNQIFYLSVPSTAYEGSQSVNRIW